MKKILAFLLGIVMCLGLVACKEQKPDFEITTEFSFYKDGKKSEQFLDNTFEVETRIYVCVDFTITKHAPGEETIAFVVQIPYAEYYSTKDFYSGTIRPKENLYEQQDLKGNKYTVMELNQMNFIIDDNNSHVYHYVFEIEARQVCESAEFMVRFKPENTNLSVKVNDQEDNKAKTTYTFVSKED